MKEIIGNLPIGNFLAHGWQGIQVDRIDISIDGEEYSIEYHTDGEYGMYDVLDSVLDETLVKLKCFDSHGRVIENSKLYSYLSKIDNYTDSLSCQINKVKIKFVDYTNIGGYEEGFIDVELEDIVLQFDIVQYRLDYDDSDEVLYGDDETKEYFENNGYVLDEELKEILLNKYEYICTNINR
jgi:hypothetical protein